MEDDSVHFEAVDSTALKLEVMASGTSLPKLAIAIQQIGLKYKGQWQEKVLKEFIG